MASKLSIQEFGEFIASNGKFLEENSECSYIIPCTIQQIKKFLERSTQINDYDFTTLSLFNTFLEEQLWNRNSSAASLELSFEQQIALIKTIGEALAEFGEGLKEKNQLRIHDASQKLVIFHKKLNRTAQRHTELKVPEDIDASKLPYAISKNLVNLLAKQKTIQQFEDPIVLLKGGFRSFFFINFDRIVLNPSSSEEFCKILGELINYEVKEKNLQNPQILLLAKTAGEALSTLQSSQVITAIYKRDCAILSVNQAFKKDYVVHGEISKNRPKIVIDEMVSRGGTITEAKQYLEDNKLGKAYYTCLLLRGDRLVKASHLDLFPIITSAELTECGLWTPELSLVTLNDRNWMSLDLRQDQLLELFLYCKASLSRYSLFRERMESLVADTYGLDLKNRDSALINYLMNFHVLLWDYVFRNQDKKSQEGLLGSVDLIEDFLSIEEKTGFSTKTIAKLVSEKMVVQTSELLELWDRLHRFFVINLNEILKSVDNKFTEMKDQIPIPESKPQIFYSKQEIESAMKDNLRVIKETAEMSGLPYNSEIEEKERMRLQSLYCFLNENYGKDEKIFQQWIEFVHDIDAQYKEYLTKKAMGA